MDLNKIWEQQREYNEKIFALEKTRDRDYWSRQYLLGISSQIAEVLQEIKWKRHRDESHKVAVPHNVLEEIADLLKFTTCLAQIWGFSAEDLLEAAHEKGEILDFKLGMEFKESLQGRKILVTDIDGTLADYQTSFAHWLVHNNISIEEKIISTIAMDTDLRMNYPTYYALKKSFEESGGYRDLVMYPDTANALRFLHDQNWYIIGVTARPFQTYKRIFKDTLHWFMAHDLPLDELHMMDTERILLASELIAQGNHVVMWDDNPTILQRALNSEIVVIAKKQLYNEDLSCIAVHRYSRDIVERMDDDAKSRGYV